MGQGRRVATAPGERAAAVVPLLARCYAPHVLRPQLALAVTLLAAGACAGSAAPVPSASASSASSAPPGTTSAAAPRVDLHPLTISFQGKLIARLHADGRTEATGPNAPGTTLVPGPTLHADGTMVMTRGGVAARLDDNGDIYVVQPPGVTPHEPLFGHITGDELKFAHSDRPWSVRVRGNEIEFGPDNSSVIDGEVTPSMRHTALVMAAAFEIEGAIATP